MKKVIYFILGGLVIIVILASLGKNTLKPSNKPSASHTQTIPEGKTVPKGNRVLAIDISTPKDNNYDNAFKLAKSTGMQVVNLHLNWNTLETSPGHCGNEYLSISNSYYPPQHISLSLTLRPVDTNGKQVPSDLADKNLDDPVVIERFKKCLDDVFAQIPNITLHSLVIGNEIDKGLKNDNKLWSQYINFFTATKTYAKSKKPSLIVGVTGGLDGITGFAKKHMQEINQQADVVMVTYYPINSDFTVEDPGIVKLDIESVLALYPNKKIYIKEIGYPSGEANKSSEEKQAQFVKNMFLVWDQHAAEIPFLSYSILTDRSDSFLKDSTSYYGISAKPFTEFLRSLGLRSFTGEDKKAFTIFQKETKARGW